MNRPDLAPGETAVAMGPPVLGAGPSLGTTSAIRRMSPRPRRSQARTMRSKPMIAGFARGQLLQFQEMGFGVAVALILDATLIVWSSCRAP